MIHGWIYDLHTGYLNDVAKIDPGNVPHNIFTISSSTSSRMSRSRRGAGLGGTRSVLRVTTQTGLPYKAG
jgi:hypothetical protein